MRFIYPVKDYTITSYFNSPRNYPFAPNRKQLHEGLDFVSEGDEVFCSQEGVVHEVGFDKKGYGNYVRVKHSDRFYTWYAHLEKALVEEGDPISLGTVLGIIGSTGNSTGKHLHFTLQDFIKGADNYVVPKVVDPLLYLVSNIDTINIDKLWYNSLSQLIKG